MADLIYKADGTLDMTGKSAIDPIATQTTNAAQAGVTSIAPTMQATAATGTGLIGAQTAPDLSPGAWNVSDNQTVAGNVAKIIASGSPLNDLAETRAKQEMNSRGLINSSMAVGAGQKALYESALPMATQDAATFGQAAHYNVDAVNQQKGRDVQNLQQTNLTNSAATNTQATQQAELDQQAKIANAQSANQVGMFNSEQYLKSQLDEAYQYSKVVMQNADTQTKLYMANLEANYKTLMQTDASVATLYNSTMKNIADIMVSAELTPEAKGVAIQNMQTMLTDGLTMQEAVSGLELTNLLV